MLYNTNIPDDILFGNIARGDKNSFDTLFLKYYPMLCAYATEFVRFEEAQEVVQDIMVWLWENRNQPIIESLHKNYLFKAVKSKCITLIRRNETNYKAIYNIHESLKEQAEDPDIYIVEELMSNIEKALARLPETYREAFEMNRFQHKTYNEIAVILGVSSKTVDYRIQQALKILRKELKEYLPILFLGI
ncbi:RNA polymerase sigma-70 factor [Bacteroides sp. 519]|uniref:RNA polymerase sigma-70 factor n=1 Tax=Bacteroides sp. 519 TaxID=2302937 RepID=UPI0013D847EA|nr:RNA polymerase sigma-70 factor [Bacteroides sp. 519]NDV57897.1 RNA polymerase sigma-70 factor [Bacteroides sp. 519]